MSKLKKRKRYSENNTEFYGLEGVDGCATNRALEPSYHSNSTDNDLMKQQYQRAAAGGTAPTNSSRPNNSGTNKKSSIFDDIINALLGK